MTLRRTSETTHSKPLGGAVPRQGALSTTFRGFFRYWVLAAVLLGLGCLISPSKSFADGRIVVGHDVNTLSTSLAGEVELTFAINLARFLVGADTGRILLFESEPADEDRDYAAAVEDALEANGFDTYLTSHVDDPELLNISDYDAVFFGVRFEAGIGLSMIDAELLTNYVRNGGNVYVFGGVGGGAAIEAGLLNGFLKNFGLAFRTVNNRILGVPIDSDHPIFEGITSEILASNNGTSIEFCDLNDPQCTRNEDAEIVQFFPASDPSGQGVYAVVDGTRSGLDHLVCYKVRFKEKFENRDVIVRNQFGEQAFIVKKPELLCVPSELQRVN